MKTARFHIAFDGQSDEIHGLKSGQKKSSDVIIDFMLFIGCLFQFGGVFVMQLEYDGNIHSTSKILQISYLLFGVLSLSVVLFSNKAAKSTLWNCVSLYILLALTISSSLWSTSPSDTLRASIALSLTFLFGLALAVRDSESGGIYFLIKSMSFGCFLSILFVLFFPQSSIHQETDLFQTVHAGLWRGIFTHKQSLGTFAGFNIGLILFYWKMAIKNVFFRFLSLICAIACLIGSESSTGIIIAVISTITFTAVYSARISNINKRKVALSVIIAVWIIIFALFYLNVLSFIPTLFGKTENLSGRGDSWALIKSNFNASGAMLFGGGFGSDFTQDISNGLPIDNGFLKKYLEFGIVGSTVLTAIFLNIVISSMKLVIAGNFSEDKIIVFPLANLIILSVYSITETGLMERHITSVFLAITVFIIAKNSRRVLRKLHNRGPLGNYSVHI